MRPLLTVLFFALALAGCDSLDVPDLPRLGNYPEVALAELGNLPPGRYNVQGWATRTDCPDYADCIEAELTVYPSFNRVDGVLLRYSEPEAFVGLQHYRLSLEKPARTAGDPIVLLRVIGGEPTYLE